jgi:hypothetical protein
MSRWQLAYVTWSRERRGAATYPPDFLRDKRAVQKQNSNQPFESGDRNSKTNCYLLITIC